MLKARYFKADGAASGEQSLPEWLFDGVVNETVIHRVIKAYQANQRQGTAAAKSRGQVAGGSKKPWRQKGTGRARQGTIRAAQWEGGGLAFPPMPHSWRQNVPRKVRALARRSALNSRADSERVMVVDGFELEAPKTKSIVKVLDAMDASGKVLILTDGAKENVYLSTRNLPGVETRPFGQESVYDILWANVVVIEKEALDGASPSRADVEAAASAGRGEPEVRVRDREEAEAQAAYRKARMGHGKKSRTKPVVTEKKPKVEKPAAVEAAAKSSSEEGGVDVATVKLPNVGDLAVFLAQFDDVAEVAALQERDSRKTAQGHYEDRLAELGGAPDVDAGGEEEE
jgi:large subunit ribosomal protein L4